MRVNSVGTNNPSFCARTRNNNEYDHSNAGKILGLGVFLGGSTVKIINSGGFKGILDEFSKDLAKSVGKEVSREVKELKTPLLKRMAVANMLSAFAVAAFCCIAAGGIYDSITNAKRREIADFRNYRQ